MGKVSGVGIFFIVLFVVLILAYVGWILFSRMRAQRLGLPPPGWLPFKLGGSSSGGGGGGAFPAPAPGGIVGWVNDKVRSMKNRRTAAGAYETTSYNAGAGAGGGGAAGGMPRGRGNRALDPDEAWDTRVGNETDMYGPGGYYEEQELGLHPPTSYGGSGYVGGGGGGGEYDTRGRTRSREGDERLHHGTAASTTQPKTSNPFGDEAERSDLNSLRGVSPRPIDTGYLPPKSQQHHSKNKASKGSLDESPTERRSMFRENM